MRAGLIIVGIVLLGLGVWVAIGNLHYNDTDTKAQLGPVKVEATSQKPVPAPIGYAGIVVGGILIAAGALKKTR
ncbi:MAG TPA: hypothetical protein VFK29_06550 [Rhodanobacteraceae bacterium]|jgi:hypothetical protein|nr:hypothetical protein [Rhodanobacteraceae bacterium]